MKKSVIISIIVITIIILIAAILIFRPIEVLESNPPADFIPPITETGTYTDITPKQLKEFIDSDLQLIVIDVSPNYNNGHIPGAFDYGNERLDVAISNFNPDWTYAVYSHFESFSRTSAQKLVDAGIKKVYRLKGDYQAWIDAGHDIEV